jgi:hypothetical protein
VGFGIFYNRLPNVLLTNTRLNPPFFSRVNVVVLRVRAFNTFWVQAISPFSYPANPALRTGIDPTTNSLIGSNAEYGEQTTPSEFGSL